jgi:hypothetical protein
MDHSPDIRRNPDGSIDFDFYRRRADRARRLAQRLWVKRNIAAWVELVASVVAAIAASLGNSTRPAEPCCPAHERLVCCA